MGSHSRRQNHCTQIQQRPASTCTHAPARCLRWSFIYAAHALFIPTSPLPFGPFFLCLCSTVVDVGPNQVFYFSRWTVFPGDHPLEEPRTPRVDFNNRFALFCQPCWFLSKERHAPVAQPEDLPIWLSFKARSPKQPLVNLNTHHGDAARHSRLADPPWWIDED